MAVSASLNFCIWTFFHFILGQIFHDIKKCFNNSVGHGPTLSVTQTHCKPVRKRFNSNNSSSFSPPQHWPRTVACSYEEGPTHSIQCVCKVFNLFSQLRAFGTESVSEARTVEEDWSLLLVLAAVCSHVGSLEVSWFCHRAFGKKNVTSLTLFWPEERMKVMMKIH